jgi:hypothetical protein
MGDPRWDSEHDCVAPGRNGLATHVGCPLTVAEIGALEDGAEVVVTWSGGNGPHAYRVRVDDRGERFAGAVKDDNPLVTFWPTQLHPLNRVTRAALQREEQQ